MEIAVVDVVDEEPSGFHQEETPVDCVEDATENVCQQMNTKYRYLQTIATFHNLDQESSSSRLTESELLLGKVWNLYRTQKDIPFPAKALLDPRQ